MKDKVILITGGAGFIGSNLCERLVEDNVIISLDNYSMGSIENHVSGVIYIEGETKNIIELCSDFNPDIVYHLGEYSRVEQSFDDIVTTLEYNLEGTKAVLEYCRSKSAKIIYAGSSTKYADIGKNSSPYSWSKATNTELVKNYGEWFGLDYAITYFYNVYGNREITKGKYATLIGLFTEKSKEEKSLTVVSPGTQKRNFTHISDTVDALLLVGEFGKGDEYGIGSDEAFSILEVANMFKSKSNNLEIEMLPERRGNRISAPVISQKTRKLGWAPKCSLRNYIKGENI